MEKNKKCFVITPIGDDNTEIRRQIEGVIDNCIKPALDDFDVIVSHRISETGSITDNILRHIYSDELVIANLTNLNPNVMYELAFRHAIKKPVIVIKNKLDGFELPFDVKDDRAFFYCNDIKGTSELKEQIQKFAHNIDYSKEDNDNPIARAVKDYTTLKYLDENKEVNISSKTVSILLERIDAIGKKIDKKSYGYDEQELSKVLSESKTKSWYFGQLSNIRERIQSLDSLDEEAKLSIFNDLLILQSGFKKDSFCFSGRDKEEFNYLVNKYFRQLKQKE